MLYANTLFTTVWTIKGTPKSLFFGKMQQNPSTDFWHFHSAQCYSFTTAILNCYYPINTTVSDRKPYCTFWLIDLELVPGLKIPLWHCRRKEEYCNALEVRIHGVGGRGEQNYAFHSFIHLSPAWIRTPPFAWAVFSAIFCNIKLGIILSKIIVCLEFTDDHGEKNIF